MSGEDEEGDDESEEEDSDEDDYDFDDDDEEEVDDSCPPGCDIVLYEKAWLRFRRNMISYFDRQCVCTMQSRRSPSDMPEEYTLAAHMVIDSAHDV